MYFTLVSPKFIANFEVFPKKSVFWTHLFIGLSEILTILDSEYLVWLHFSR